jgi:hypothetical protein
MQPFASWSKAEAIVLWRPWRLSAQSCWLRQSSLYRRISAGSSSSDGAGGRRGCGAVLCVGVWVVGLVLNSLPPVKAPTMPLMVTRVLVDGTRGAAH